MGRTIELTAKDGHGFSVFDANSKEKTSGALLIIQEIWGVNDHIRKVADGYAADGYLALAPAIFDRVERGLAMDTYTDATRTKGFQTMQKVKLDDALLDIAATVTAGSAAGKVGIVGFCFGGRLAWLSASRVDGLSAAVGYYGGGIPGLKAEQPRCPVMLHFGERDKGIPVASVEDFKEAHPSLPV